MKQNYTKFNFKGGDTMADIDAIREDLFCFKMNKYALVYYAGLRQSFSEYGLKGLKTQVLYFLTSVRAKGYKQRIIKKAYFAWAKKREDK